MVPTVVLIAMAASSAEAGELTVALQTSSPATEARLPLRVTLTNRSKRSLKLYQHTKTHELHYDHMDVELAYPVPSREGCNGRHTGKRRRRLKLWDSRDKSYPVFVALAPKKSVSIDLELMSWALRKPNKSRPIVPGFYKVRVIYDTRKESEEGVWKGRVRSKWLPLRIPGKIPRGRCQKNPGYKYF